MFSSLFRRRKKTSSALIAKERLQIIVAHERNQNIQSKQPDFLNALQKDILDVVRKYMPIDSNQIKVAMDKEDGCDVLELNIVLLEPEEVAEQEASQTIEATDPETDQTVVKSNETR